MLWPVLFIVLLTGPVPGCDRQAAAPSPASLAAPVEVGCEILFRGRAADVSGKVTVPAGATAFDALQAFAAQQGVTVEHRGNGASLFVESIGGVVNEGAAGDNWVYLVNDQLGDRSAGDRGVSAGDRLVWRFGRYP
jgi:Domain of unknown function (DUF4430)